jgi:hypothetical protein
MLAATAVLAASAASARLVEGRVLGGNAAIAGSTVTVWAASAGTPREIGHATTDGEGRFSVDVPVAADGTSHYLIAKGGRSVLRGGENPAITLVTVLGNEAPQRITINEFTSIAAAWTHAQFIDNRGISGHPLGLKIAAGNMPNFVDLATGGWGEAIQGPLNGGQTPTMANFATLADAMAGCVTSVRANACALLFAAAQGPDQYAPRDTFAAIRTIARNPWYKPSRTLALIADFYPTNPRTQMREVPFMPYLLREPSAWVLPLKFDGGGYRAGGKAMFDSQGNLWVGDNFTIGWQGQDSLWQGHASKFAPNGKPLSPITTGFSGGGMEGGTFGAAVDANDNAWFTTYGSKAIAVFDKTGKPLTPPEGLTFGGRLGLMQGIIVTKTGDVWALGIEKAQLVYFPKGDIAKGRIVCEGNSAEPCKSFAAPFHLAIDQQDRIWVSNSGAPHVTVFSAADPTKVEKHATGINNSGMAIDSLGNAWIANRFGTGVLGMAHLVDMGVHLKAEGVASASDYLTSVMSKQKGGEHGGSVTLLRPDGTSFPGAPFKSGGLPGPWAVVVDGNDNVWISNFAGPSSPIVELCGARTETCPPGFKTGDQISPPNGYVGGGLQMLTDIAVDPAGNVWAMNNWQDIDACIGVPPEALSTRCGGQGVVIFYGMAAPVASPQIGPARRP